MRAVLSYLACRIAKIFWGFVPGPHWVGLIVSPRFPSCTTVFLLAMLIKKLASPKNCWIQHWPTYFYKKILIPPFLDFSKIPNPYKQRGSHYEYYI